MKKNLTLAILFVALFSCSKESTIQTEKDIIGFSTYSPISKGVAIANNDEFQKSGNKFGVTAFISTVDIDSTYLGETSKGETVTSYDGSWTYTNTKYWPAGSETLDFYAYTPFENTNRVATPEFSKANGMGFTNYEVNTDVSKQEDFMYAFAKNQSKTTASSGVSMQFKHAMSQVHFTAKTVGSLRVKIESITLHNINSKGNFTLKDAGVWSDPSIQTNFVATLQNTNTEINNSQTVLTNKAAGNATVMMLMPQAITKWDIANSIATNDGVSGTKGAYLKISCKIYDAVGNTYFLGAADAYGKTYIPFESTWEQGKIYTYNLIFGGGYNANGEPILSPITFTTDVTAWSNNDDIDM